MYIGGKKSIVSHIVCYGYSKWPPPEKRTFFVPCKIRVNKLEFPWLIFYSLLRVEVFYIIVVKWVENPQEKINLKKSYLHSLNDL
jgi:hypothetical protein